MESPIACHFEILRLLIQLEMLESTMQFDLNQFNISKSLTVSFMITMVLHLGYSTVEQSFSGNNTFSSNCRSYSGCFGGGIYVEASEANFSDIATFDGNSGSEGGGIYARDNSGVSFSGTTSFK